MNNSRDFAAEYIRAQCGSRNAVSLAMGYVAWHNWEDIFDPDEALGCGTAFPSLNLPFTAYDRKGGC